MSSILCDLLQVEYCRSEYVCEHTDVHGCWTDRNGCGCGGSVSIRSGELVHRLRNMVGLAYQYGLGPESFQLQMGLSFPFLRAKDLRTSLLIMRTRSFLLSYM